MIKAAQVAIEQHRSLRSGTTLSRSRTIETPAGILVMQDFCSPAFVESLRAENGLRAFARRPEREHQLLVGIARRPDSALVLAHTLSGEIVAEVTVAPADDWWDSIEQVYEVAIQVISGWRRLGIARQLLDFALELDALEEIILLAMGLSWHWDMEGLGLSRFQYRQLIAQLFGRQGFAEYLTSEPNICMDPANILLARIGSHVKQEAMNDFFNSLLRSQTLPGL